MDEQSYSVERDFERVEIGSVSSETYEGPAMTSFVLRIVSSFIRFSISGHRLSPSEYGRVVSTLKREATAKPHTE